MTAPDPLTVRQREIVTQATEMLILTAAAIAAGMRGVDLNDREAVYQAAYSLTKVRLGMALAVVDELAITGPVPGQDADARMVGEVRAVLAAFDWEHDDRQYALEAIERIVLAGDEPGPCPGCVGRGTGTWCYVCDRPIPPGLRRQPDDPPEYRQDCADCAAGRAHVHSGAQ